MNLIFLDTETTGFGNCRLIELAWMQEGEPLRAMRVKPPIPIEAQAIAVHGITEAMLEGLPAFELRPEYPVLKELFEKNVVIAHNASFDIGVLAREGIVVDAFIDTRKIAQKLYKNAPNHKLQGLRDYLHLEVEGEAHSAAGDVAVLAALFAQMRADMSLKFIPEEHQVEQMILSSK